jgi:iron complex outermembrane receptor protein
LSGFWAHVDAQYNSDFRNPFTGANLSTQPFARAPANARSASARIDLPVPSDFGDASVGVRYFAQDEYSVTDTFNPLTSIQSAYEVFDFFGDWNSVGGSDVDLSFFVNNAFDDESVMTVFSAGPVHSGLPNEPRTYGVRVRYNFGE